ncbi:CDP-archaeol synthase [Waterburya agarophytonicola K14]|uniref:CDP-archaeol synthase n=1 Tax=Waterburya agarophytonicola KI4 TaxID=2874699 RepID=A0A964BS42_9CYAN|nr:CDP-archaeol synthase [Waterburya agarophytonicola]MCC0178713.1 CDP-archaeol synthase [Waterburya agarophytonicola KI4]
MINDFIPDTLNLLWLALGLFIAGVIEAVLWKTKVFQWLNIPIQTELFGANKKWRGLISLPLAMLASVYLLHLVEIYLPFIPEDAILFSDFNLLEFGLLVGFVFNLSELPNSFIKRRLDIPPGDESSKMFYFVDHMDSTYGVLILWYLYFHFPLHFILTGLVVTPLLFMGATELRKKLGLK